MEAFLFNPRFWFAAAFVLFFVEIAADQWWHAHRPPPPALTAPGMAQVLKRLELTWNPGSGFTALQLYEDLVVNVMALEAREGKVYAKVCWGFLSPRGFVQKAFYADASAGNLTTYEGDTVLKKQNGATGQVPAKNGQDYYTLCPR